MLAIMTAAEVGLAACSGSRLRMRRMARCIARVDAAMRLFASTGVDRALHYGGTDVVASSQRRARASARGRVRHRSTKRACGPARRDRQRSAASLAAGNAEATWLNAGAAEVQPWGTDNAPSVAALPTPAVTAVPPIPGELKAPAPEPRPGFSADPNTWNPLPKALVVDPIEFMTEPAEPSIDARRGDARNQARSRR